MEGRKRIEIGWDCVVLYLRVVPYMYEAHFSMNCGMLSRN